MEQITLMKYQSAIKKTAPEFFYSEENGCLFKGDSLEVLKKIRDASVDLIFADPPYSIKKLWCCLFYSSLIFHKCYLLHISFLH